MRRPVRLVITGLMTAWSLLLNPAFGHAGTEVDLALVIAVDVSYSMDPEEQELQREGFADAFRSPLVHNAIRNGQLGKIAVTYMDWAAAYDQRVVLPWTVLDNSEAILAFADQIAAIPLRRGQRTSVSGAIDAAVKLLESSNVDASRKVIDVSGDGANNHGRPVVQARDAAIAKGITINGLPIMLKQPGYWDIPTLDNYFRDCVIGGQGAFMIPARDKAQFPQIIKTKILLEVSRVVPTAEPIIKTVQSATTRTDCLSGEAVWRDRMGN
jgi:Protein of unknown function (DUF1194)